MKKSLIAVVLASSALFMSQFALADAGGLEGTLTKLEANSVTIKDSKGKEITATIDEKTKKRGGEPQEGQLVELYIKNDKVTMIEILKK